MASQSLAPSIWSGFGNLFGALTKHVAHEPTPKSSASDLRAEREFINEMIWNNPDAFSSELDVQNMMNLFPGRI